MADVTTKLFEEQLKKAPRTPLCHADSEEVREALEDLDRVAQLLGLAPSETPHDSEKSAS